MVPEGMRRKNKSSSTIMYDEIKLSTISLHNETESEREHTLGRINIASKAAYTPVEIQEMQEEHQLSRVSEEPGSGK